jgi:hypothetical protein
MLFELQSVGDRDAGRGGARESHDRRVAGGDRPIRALERRPVQVDRRDAGYSPDRFDIGAPGPAQRKGGGCAVARSRD